MGSFSKHELGQTLMIALRDFQCHLDADLAKRGVRGISSRHHKVFMHLDRNNASRSVDLAEKIGVRPQSMMKTIHELESLGFVKRSTDPSDARAKLVAFTKQGQDFIDELSQSTETVWERYAALVDERELKKAMLLLASLSQLSVEEVA